jgi:hypothetical protein
LIIQTGPNELLTYIGGQKVPSNVQFRSI